MKRNQLRTIIIVFWAAIVLLGTLTGCGGGNSGGPGGDPTPGQSSIYTVGGVSFTMRYAPGASFTSDDDDIVGDSNLPESVTVANAYWMAETEVTYQLWEAVRIWATHDDRGPNKYYFQNGGRQGGNLGSGPIGTDQHPVTTVSWRDAMVWCNALSEMAGLAPVYKNGGAIVRDTTNMTLCNGVSEPSASDKGFRLPTSDEWQLAARYQDGKIWTPGNHVSGDTTGPCWVEGEGTVSAEFGNYAWHLDNSGDSTHPVGGKTANALKIKDMSGNVWEWCFDWYPNGSYSHRVMRGGSWQDDGDDHQLGLVCGYDPGSNFSYLGFRPVRTQ
jgi:sulfatase modifying factor 1